MERVTRLRPGVYAGPLAFSGCKGITLDHVNAVRVAFDRATQVLKRPAAASRDFEHWNCLGAVRCAVSEVASGAGFDPETHDLRLTHARAIAEAMNEEVHLTRAALRKGRIRTLETFDLLTEVQDFVCDVIEQAMEPCL